jgi:hypothetical protein
LTIIWCARKESGMSQPDWVAEDIDTDQPSAARVYDYLLGGSHNFAADRAFARQVVELLPDGVELFFSGLTLVEPGVVWAPLWRPESPADVPDHPEASGNYVGVARKP